MAAMVVVQDAFEAPFFVTSCMTGLNYLPLSEFQARRSVELAYSSWRIPSEFTIISFRSVCEIYQTGRPPIILAWNRRMARSGHIISFSDLKKRPTGIPRTCAQRKIGRCGAGSFATSAPDPNRDRRMANGCNFTSDNAAATDREREAELCPHSSRLIH